MSAGTVTALVLSAGRSQRMGHPKASLLFDGERLLERAVRTSIEAGLTNVVVVVGAESRVEARNELGHVISREEALERIDALPRHDATVVAVVASPDGALIDSIRTGLAACPAQSAILLWPVDHPFCDAALLRSMRAFAAPSRIVVPTHDGQRGHPVLFGADVVDELRSPSADEGAHHVVHRDPARVVTVETSDVRIASSVNTVDEAAALGIALPGDASGG